MAKAYLFYGLLILAVLTAGCGGPSFQKASQLYDQERYYEAAQMFEEVYSNATKKERKAEISFKAAESYRQFNNYRKAEVWYKRADRLDYPDPVAKYRYAEMLRNQEDWEDALEAFKEYRKENPGDEKAYQAIQFLEQAIQQETADSRFVVEDFGKINSSENDYAPMWFEDEALFFATDRDVDDVKGKDTYGRTGNKFSDIFYAPVEGSGRRRRNRDEEEELKFEDAHPVSGDVNTEANEGTQSFGERGRYMYFTRCNGAEREDSNCVIMVARRTGDDWTKPEMMPFCNDSNPEVQYGHPYVTKDGKHLYFAARGLEESYGGRDLYVSNYVSRGRTWSDPINLGPKVNTSGDELFPVKADDTTLYFSSNGHPGLGGLDLFRSYGETANWEPPENLGIPMNSGADDFAMTFDPDGEGGFFSSNRPGSRGDDIYRFEILPLEFNLTGIVYNQKTQEPVSEASVTLVNMDDSTEMTVQSDVSGGYEFELEAETDYSVSAKKPNFFGSESGFVSTKGLKVSEDFKRDLYLTPFRDTITLSGIYYDLDKATLRESSLPVLDSLVNILNEYPYITIEIGSHTDCRASKSYNKDLSQRRAQSVVDYLTEQGIDRQRLESKGYGESKLVNKCSCENGKGPGRNDPDCTEEMHQENRRTTFYVLSTDYNVPESQKTSEDDPVIQNPNTREGREAGEGSGDQEEETP